MIHRELCDPIYTKDYSKKEIRFYLVLSRHVGFDGVVLLDYHKISQLVNCKLQHVYDLVKKGLKHGVIALNHLGQIVLNKKVVNEEYKRGYVQHLSFLESPEFEALPVQSQRFILWCLFIGVHHEGRTLTFEVDKLYHVGNRRGKFNLYHKHEAYNMIQQAKTFLECETFEEDRVEWVYVSGLKAAYRGQILENRGEELWLNQFLRDEMATGWLSEEGKLAVLGLKQKYTTFMDENNKLIVDPICVGLFVRALKKLLSLPKLISLNSQNNVGPYFKSILDDVFEKMARGVQNQLFYAQQMANEVKTIASTWSRYTKDQWAKISETMKRSYKELFARGDKIVESSDPSDPAAVDPPPILNNKEKEDLPFLIKSIQGLLGDKGIRISSRTIKNWKAMDSSSNILLAVNDALKKPEIDNVIGYVTNTLKNGYTPPAQTIRFQKDDLPDWVRNQVEAQNSPTVTQQEGNVSKDKQLEILDLLFQLGDLSIAEYEERKKEIENEFRMK